MAVDRQAGKSKNPGSTSATTSTKYTAGIKVSATETIKAIAIAPGYDPSAVESAKYSIQSDVAAVHFVGGAAACHS
jgi:hypothetical protein